MNNDLISRSGLKKALSKYAGFTEKIYLNEFIKEIDNASSVEVPENAVNCILTMFGECSYNETGCHDCEIKVKIRKALSQRPQGDLISRDALKKAIFIDEPISITDTWEQLYDAVVKAINNAPVVEYTFEEAFQKTVCDQRLYCPERPQGEWIIDGHHRRCKKCGEYFCIADSEGNEIPSKFCPNCGARMQKGD